MLDAQPRDATMDDVVDHAANGGASLVNAAVNGNVQPMQSHAYAGGRWRLLGKQFLWQQGAQVRAYDYHRPTAKLLVAYTNGLFELYQVCDCVGVGRRTKGLEGGQKG